MSRTPPQTFWSDQALAFARETADDKTIVVVADFPAGEQCSWCDCPLGPDSPHMQPGYRCAGCPRPAETVLRVHDGTPVRFDYPVCEKHHPDVVATFAQAVSGGPR